VRELCPLGLSIVYVQGDIVEQIYSFEREETTGIHPYISKKISRHEISIEEAKINFLKER